MVTAVIQCNCPFKVSLAEYRVTVNTFYLKNLLQLFVLKNIICVLGCAGLISFQVCQELAVSSCMGLYYKFLYCK